MDPQTSPIPAVRTGTFHGLDAWWIETGAARAVVSRFGGQLLSFAPAGAEEVFWLSPQLAPLPTPIRGGVPVCWPYFGREGQPAHMPAHGHARTQPWELAQARQEADGRVFLELGPTRPDPGGLVLSMQLWIGAWLEQHLLTRNPGQAPVEFGEALHSYFRVGDARQVRVQGLDGLEYLDKNDGMARHRQHGAWTLHDPRDPARCDRIYRGGAGQYRIDDPVLGRSLLVQTASSASVVVWNPGQAGGAAMADVGAHWSRFLCVEAGNVGPDPVQLAPGSCHVLVQRIDVQPLCSPLPDEVAA